jgi:hypothetical protein
VVVLEPLVHWSLAIEESLGHLPLKIKKPLDRYALLIGGSVLGQPIGPNLRVKQKIFLDSLTLKDWTDKLSRNVGN